MSHFLQTAVRALRAAGLALCLIGAVGAMPAWAQHLLEGGTPPRKSDYVGALKRWQPLAERGDAVAQYHLGLMYKYGEGVDEDQARALALFQQSADQGDSFGIRALARLKDELKASKP